MNSSKGRPLLESTPVSDAFTNVGVYRARSALADICEEPGETNGPVDPVVQGNKYLWYFVFLLP